MDDFSQLPYEALTLALNQLRERVTEQDDEIIALRSAVVALIETHPNRQAFEDLLSQQRFRLETLLNADHVPDHSIAKILAHIDLLLHVAKHTPSSRLQTPQYSYKPPKS